MRVEYIVGYQSSAGFDRRGRWVFFKRANGTEFSIGMEKYKEDAVKKARKKAKRNRPSKLVVQARDGSITEETMYDR